MDMEAVLEHIDKINKDIRDKAIADGDYLVDGILYCQKCKTPKEMDVENIGLQFITCECENIRITKEQQQRELEEHNDKVYNLKKYYVEDRQYLTMTFDKMLDEIGDLKWSKRYVDEWQNIKNISSSGLMLYGDTGTGKTFIACCIGNALIETEQRVLIANIADMVDKISGFSDDKKTDYMEKIRKCDLLIIDDFGASRTTDYANELLYRIIDTRYRAEKPFIITTNLSPKQLTEEKDIGLKRIYERVIERCRAKQVNKIKWRINLAVESKKRMDSILFDT